ncbi:hypothetical protein E2C01_021526 [Portunus trituberculatus]|uniref:Uncharacterized protein n=1 Tax=Portunus trituberculatus TaxID=210409 RepID=A0A5B7E4L5_PORTR|nr:hypothetical protein [Portunus trituberculatus]
MHIFRLERPGLPSPRPSRPPRHGLPAAPPVWCVGGGGEGCRERVRGGRCVVWCDGGSGARGRGGWPGRGD